MDIFCVRIGVFCGYHSDPGKVRHKKNRFRRGDCGQDYSRADLCMDNGLDSRLGARHNSAQCKDVGVSCALGAATGASWLCYFKALQDGPASAVVPIDKLSILVSIAFSFFVFKERLSKKAAAGLVLIVAGTMMMLV